MHFVSFGFALLFAVVYASRLTLGRTKTEPRYFLLLLVASLVFYGWHIPLYLSVILTSTCVDFFAGIALGRADLSSAMKRWVLTASLATNLGLLCFFKYTDFLIVEVARLLGTMGVEVGWQPLGLILPMGISFYTFQSMSYTIDVYRGDLEPQRDFRRFLLFVAFFPQIIAGPIVRASEFLYQIGRTRKPRLIVFSEGLYLIIRGFFLKMVCADNLRTLLDTYWAELARPDVTSALVWLIAPLFIVHMFCDFAGYSSIARGLAYLLGFRLPVNFNAPLLTTTFRGLWGRWHITLGRWLRDYLYVSLGGNRRGKLRTLFNIFLVMFIGGIWHGAAIPVILFGISQGIALVVERQLGMHAGRGALARFLWALVVHATLTLTWVVWRSESLEQMTAIWTNAFAFRAGSFGRVPLELCALLALPAFVLHARVFLHEQLGVRACTPWEKALAAGVMAYFILTAHGVNSDFVYFQF